MVRTAYKYLALRPWKVGLAFFVAGFGILAVSYLGLMVVGSSLLRLRGLFSYFSATIGDGLLLPIAAAVSATTLRDLGGLVARSLRSEDEALQARAKGLKERLEGPVLRWVPALLALVATAAVHIAWLLNPLTQPNWTIAPGRLNFFGYWHAAFFVFVLWWFLAFLARLGLALRLFGKSHSGRLVSQSLAVWVQVNVFLAALAGFATLLYLDNYGLRFSWSGLLSSVTTLIDLALTIVVLLGANIYFLLAVYKPASANGAIQAHTRVALQSWTAFAFGCLLVGGLITLVAAVSSSSSWCIAAVIAGVLIPGLFAEDYAADLFWNRGRAPRPEESLGICLILVISSAGLLTATAIALQGSEVKTVAQIVSSWAASSGVSLVTSLICVGIAWIASLPLRDERPNKRPGDERWYVTDQPPLHNIAQNFLQFWGLFQVVAIPIAIFVYHDKAPLMKTVNIGGTIELLIAASACIAGMVMFPLNNNYSHLRDLEGRRQNYICFTFISAHIWIITICVGAVAIFVLGWLWMCSLDTILKGP